jgi:ATP-dependent DNA ligase
MKLPVMPPLLPMLSLAVESIPEGDLLYEPKWDGFRAIVFKDGDELKLQSRNQRPLERYFPELVTGLGAALPDRCVLDGEVVIAGPKGLDFDALLQRIHPARSRIDKLARETPAAFVAFDVLALGDEDLRELPQAERRARLETALAGARSPLFVTPCTRDVALARAWFERFEGAGFDGVIAKPAGLPYTPDKRVMFKIKHRRSADVVIGGYRLGRDGKGLASLLLGLFDGEGRLHHVGVASSLPVSERKRLAALLDPLRVPEGGEHPWRASGDDALDADLPEAETRWSRNKKMEWVAIEPRLVAEVAYDHLQGDRFRHATRFVHLRPDRDPGTCTYAQLDVAPPAELSDLFR